MKLRSPRGVTGGPPRAVGGSAVEGPSPRESGAARASEALGVLSVPRGDLDALRAIQAALPPQEFWSPWMLGQFHPGLVDALVDGIVGQDPALKGSLGCARGMRSAPALKRIWVMDEVVRFLPEGGPLAYALSWAAGLSPQVSMGLTSRFGQELRLVGSEVRWLPEGLSLEKLDVSGSRLQALPGDLQVSGSLNMSQCTGIRELPMGLQPMSLYADESGLVGLPGDLGLTSNLMVSSCPMVRSLPEGLRLKRLWIDGSGITSLPSDLQVSYRIELGRTPLERLSDEEILAMCPGISGYIVR